MSEEYETGLQAGTYKSATQIKNVIDHWKRAAKRLRDKGQQPDTIDRNQYLYDILVMIENEIDVIIRADAKD